MLKINMPEFNIYDYPVEIIIHIISLFQWEDVDYLTGEALLSVRLKDSRVWNAPGFQRHTLISCDIFISKEAVEA